MLDGLKRLLKRPCRPPQPCRHDHLFFDAYHDTRIVTCACGEMWVSEEAPRKWVLDEVWEDDGLPL